MNFSSGYIPHDLSQKLKKKIRIFSKGIAKDYSKIWKENFLVIFWHNIPGNILFLNNITKNSPPRPIKKAFLNIVQNLSFRMGLTHDFGAELRNFLLVVFWAKKFLKIMFLNILNRKG